MFPENRFKKVPVKHLCAKKSKKTPSIANISMRISKIEAVWRIDDFPFAKPHLFFFFQIGHLKTKTAGIGRTAPIRSQYSRRHNASAPVSVRIFPQNTPPQYVFLIYILLTNA